MYIALTMQKLLEEKGEFKKLAGIPTCVIYNQDDMMPVQDHILLNEAKLKEDYMEAMTIGEPSLDIGMMISDLLWKKADGVLILGEDEAAMLQKKEIQRDRYTLYVATSLKEALEIYKKNTKKSAGKRVVKKTEKPEKEATASTKPTTPVMPKPTVMEQMDTPPEMEESHAMEEGFADTPLITPDMKPVEETDENEFGDEINDGLMEDQDAPVMYDQNLQEVDATYNQEAQNHVAQSMEGLDGQKYEELRNELMGVGVPDSLMDQVMMALQKSTNVSDCYDCMEETIGNIDDVLVIYDAIQEYYDTFKTLADQIGTL